MKKTILIFLSAILSLHANNLFSMNKKPMSILIAGYMDDLFHKNNLLGNITASKREKLMLSRMISPKEKNNIGQFRISKKTAHITYWNIHKEKSLKKTFKKISDQIEKNDQYYRPMLRSWKILVALHELPDYNLFFINTNKAISISEKITKKLNFIFYLYNDTQVSKFFANPNIYSRDIRKEWLMVDLNTKNLNLLDIILKRVGNKKLQYKNFTAIQKFKDILVLAKLAQNKKLFRKTVHAAYVLEGLKQIVPGELAAQIIGFTGVETLAGKELISKKYRHKKEKKLKKKIKKTNSQESKLCTIL
ncbi:hypothetical protein ACFLYU_05240 [Candidatus Dependentiae bacterium]